jgi:FKBP-type peptidyl-prolyl cis-trans isomerase
MMHERFGFSKATGVSSSKRKSSRKKVRDRRLDSACLEALESRFLLSSAVQVEGSIPTLDGYVNQPTLVAIPTGEVAPNATAFTDFGPTTTGTALTRTYTITNIGNTTLNLSGAPFVTLAGDTTDFSVSAQPGSGVIAPNTSENFTVTYTPSTVGTVNATFTIASDDPAGPFTFEVQAENLATTAQSGVQISTTGIGTGAAAAIGQILVMDYQGFLTNGDEFDASSQHGSHFEFSLGSTLMGEKVIDGWNSGLLGLQVGQSRTMIIPSAQGYGAGGSPPGIPGNSTLIFTTTLVDIITISGKVNGNPVSIASTERAPAANNATDYGAFASVVSPAQTNTFVITDVTGNLASELSNPQVTIAGSPSFTVTQPVIAGGTGTFTATYTPSVGNTNAIVTLVPAASIPGTGADFEIQAEGPANANAPQIAVAGDNASATSPIASGESSPTYASWTDFGPTASDGSVAITREYTVTNNGNATLNLTNPTFTGPNAGAFSITQEPSATVAPSGSTTFTVSFTASTALTETATLNLGSNAAGSPFTFEIKGEGESMSTSGDGLKTAVVAGNGTAAQNGEMLVFNYTGYLLDGTKFGTANPFELVLGDPNVLAGLNEGFAGAKVGDQRTIVIPAGLNTGTVPAATPGVELIYVTTVTNIMSIKGGSPTQEILSGEAAPSTANGTDFGTFATVTAPAMTMNYQLTVPTGAVSTLLTGSPLTISGSPAFSIASQPSFTGTLANFSLKYTPSVGTTNATVTIHNSTGLSNQTFEVQAEGPATANVGLLGLKGNNAGATSPITTGEAAPTQVTWTDFGPTAADGSVPVTRSYTITNNGNGTLDLTNALVQISGGDAADFTVLTQPSSTIAAGQSTNFTIQFKPTEKVPSDATRTTEIIIASNDPNGPFQFKVQGEAQVMTVAANGLQTKTTTPGSGAMMTANGELLIMNYTGYLADGTKFDSSLNAGRTPFQFVLGQGNVIQGWDQGLVGMKLGESRTLIIPAALAYGAAGNGAIPANATLIFTVTLVNIISVQGNGVVIPNGESVASAANATDFGTHALGDAPVINTFTITCATGSLASVLTGTAVTIVGSPSFTVTQPTFPTATTGTFTVTYTPSKGQTAASITIHNVSNQQPNLVFGVQGTGPIGVNSGVGPKITVIGDNEFASIPIGNGSTATNAQQIWTNFGENAIGGNVSVTRTYKITNTGTTTLTLTGANPVTISGAGAADFSVTSQPSASIAPGASSDFTITFKATVPGARGGVVTIASNDSQNPFTFLIAGTGLVVTTGTDGLMTATTVAGNGPGAQNGDILVINYSGFLLDGTEFDSSLFPNRTAFQFLLGKQQVITGWDEGLVGMKVGESRTLIIPASLAYGANGAGSVPPNATLIFTTTLVNIISVSGVQNNGAYVFIPSGDNTPSANDGTDFGFVAGGGANVTHTFVVTAPGGYLPTLLAANPVTLSGAGAAAFTVALSKPTYTADGVSMTFTITYVAGNAGLNVATVSINNGSKGDPNLTFNVQGQGPTGSDGSVSVANTDQITGFAYNPMDLSDTLDIKVVFDDGLLTQTIPANQNSADVQNLTGSPNHGFDYAMPMMTVGMHTASIYAVDNKTGTTTLLATRQITSQNSLFDEHYYLMANPDVAAAVAAGKFASGYDHYIQFGQFEGRSPSPYWNEKYYLAMNPDVADAVAAGKISSGFMHYYLYGQYENRPGLVYFNTGFYDTNNPDVAAAISANGPITSAFEHFCDYGQYENRSPTLYFSSTVYDAHNPDILPYIDGEPFSSDYEHYVLFGQYEGRVASNFYKEQTYLGAYGDVSAAVQDGAFPDGLQHWLEYGQYEGRNPDALSGQIVGIIDSLLGDVDLHHPVDGINFGALAG